MTMGNPGTLTSEQLWAADALSRLHPDMWVMNAHHFTCGEVTKTPVRCVIKCASESHSNDQTTVYNGSSEPIPLCGYHAERFSNGESIKDLNNFYVWLYSEAPA